MLRATIVSTVATLFLSGCGRLLAANDGKQGHSSTKPDDGRAAQSIMPVGSIVSYAGTTDGLRGTGWVPCDGALVDAAYLSSYGLKYAAPEFQGRRLPDLRGRFLRGVGAGESVMEVGGSDMRKEVRTDIAGKHSHTGTIRIALTGETGGIAPTANDADTGYLVHDDVRGWTQEAYLRVETGKGSREGQHTHTLRGQPIDTPAVINEAGEHQHNIEDIPLPPFAKAHFIVRIQ